MNNINKRVCKDISALLKKDLKLVLNNTSVPLFQPPFNMSSEELLYLYFYFKRKYKFKRNNELILNKGFLSIDNIVKFISI